MGPLEEWLRTLLLDYGLVAIFVTMTLESMCVPIPSEIVVPFGGVLASQGYTQLWMVVVVATVANLVGSSIAYAAGRYGGRALVLNYGKYFFMSVHHLEMAEDWFARRGEITVFVTRMMPGIRTFISVPAGVAKMPFGRFLLYSAFGAVIWNLALASLGYLFGSNWELLQQYFSRYNLVFFGLLALTAVGLALWKWRNMRRRQTSRP